MQLLSSTSRARIASFDTRTDAILERLRGRPLADLVFYGASQLGDFSLIWLILGALRGLRSEHDWHAAVRVGVVMGAESLFVNVGIKSLFRRTRPPWEIERSLPLRRPRTSSFPSGHATSGFCAAVILSDDDALGPLYFLVAALVASSRVYVKIHHASDVLAGIPLGLALGLLARRLLPLPARPLRVPPLAGVAPPVAPPPRGPSGHAHGRAAVRVGEP